MGRKSFFLITLVISLHSLCGCAREPAKPSQKVEKGRLDLTQIQFDKEIVKLDGQWEIYWDKLLAPGDDLLIEEKEYITLPGNWSQKVEGNRTKSGHGYGTYRLLFKSNDDRRLALKVPRISTAYKLWINGELETSAGVVGETRKETTAQYLPQIVFFEPREGENELILQVSNFHQYKGGIFKSLSIGSEEQILKIRYKHIAKDFLLFGSLIAIGIYNLVLFIFNKKNKSPLYFGLFCIMIGLRTFLVGECFDLFFQSKKIWGMLAKITSLIFYLGVPMILRFFRSLFPKYFKRGIIIVTQFVALVFGVIVMLTPARIFTIINPFYQIWTVLLIVYITSVFLKIIINREKDSAIIITGATFLLITGLNDIIFYSTWRNGNQMPILKKIVTSGNLSSLGQFIFAIINALLLAKTFSQSLKGEKIMTAKLMQTNRNLDSLVLERTHDLIESNEKIRDQKLQLERNNRQLEYSSLNDALTGLGNRRQYDQRINEEWGRCLRKEKSIALIIIDVDNFKLFNDTYGHLVGDQCLAKIGETLKQSLGRSMDRIARYGGEEFVVLLAETDKEEAIYIANKLRSKIEELQIPHKNSSASEWVTISAGVSAEVPDQQSSHEDLFKKADRALYKAKELGKNQVVFL